MEVKYILELRVNFQDEGKHEPIKDMLRAMALHAKTAADLLADGQKSQVAFRGDDFFEPQEDIELLAKFKFVDSKPEEQDAPSPEMLEALARRNARV